MDEHRGGLRRHLTRNLGSAGCAETRSSGVESGPGETDQEKSRNRAPALHSRFNTDLSARYTAACGLPVRAM